VKSAAGNEVCPPQAAVIVASGGSGLRFGDNTAKQFLELAGRPVLAHTLSALEKHPRIGQVTLVLPQSLIPKGEALVAGDWPDNAAASYRKVSAIVAGGEDRQESVANGLAALSGSGWDGIVLVHDGVRPCTPGQVFDRVVEGVLARGNAVAAIPLRDTIKRAGDDGFVLETLDRRGLWQIQTPQGFWMRDLIEAYREGRRRGIQATDDAALVEALGQQVYLTAGDPANIKLTYPEDRALLEALLWSA